MERKLDNGERRSCAGSFDERLEQGPRELERRGGVERCIKFIEGVAGTRNLGWSCCWRVEEGKMGQDKRRDICHGLG